MSIRSEFFCWAQRLRAIKLCRQCKRHIGASGLWAAGRPTLGAGQGQAPPGHGHRLPMVQLGDVAVSQAPALGGRPWGRHDGQVPGEGLQGGRVRVVLQPLHRQV